jgi:hypothetical protein
MSSPRVTLAAIALTLTAAAGAAAQDFGAGTPESRYFRVDSAVAPGRHGPQVQGYVYNVYDAHAVRVRLRVEELDATGRVLETRTVLVPLDVPARGRAFFEAPAPAGTAAARVTVLSFEWASRGGGGGM